jgi:predicted PurR-regulated permease PerM
MIRTDTGYNRNINWVFIALFAVIITIILWQIRNILMLALAAVLLTVFASMPVRFLVNRGLNRGLAILISVAGGIFAIVLLSLVVFPTLFQQFTVLFTDIIPQGFEQLVERWNSGELYQQFPFLEETLSNFTIDNNLINQILTQFGNALGQVSGSVIPLIGGVASTVLSFLIIVFLGMYLLAEPDRYLNGVLVMTPLWYRERMREILARLDATVRAWLRVTGVSMLLVGAGTALGLALIGIQQWVALGVLAGVMSFIPNFGPIGALIPSIAVAIIQAPQYLFVVVLIIYGISFIQSQVVGPILASENMNLAPVLILIGQIVFGLFFGFLGIMLAVPLTAITVVLIEEIYIKDILGDTPDNKPKHDEPSLSTGEPVAETD